MRNHYSVLALLIVPLTLIGCDRITGAADQKIFDAESIGYACRISRKTPEDCMKENDTQSPTSLLNGWKAADKDVSEKSIDPSMGASSPAPAIAQSEPAATAAGNKAAAETPAEKPAQAKSKQPAKSKAKPGNDEAAKPSNP